MENQQNTNGIESQQNERSFSRLHRKENLDDPRAQLDFRMKSQLNPGSLSMANYMSQEIPKQNMNTSPNKQEVQQEFLFNSSDSDADEDKQVEEQQKFQAPNYTPKLIENNAQKIENTFQQIINSPEIKKLNQDLCDHDAMPLIKAQSSLLPDMQFGWKPEVKTSHPPIPLYFDFVEHNFSVYNFNGHPDETDIIVYQEDRLHDSYKMHKTFANQPLCNGFQSYKFNFPKNYENGRFVDDGMLGKIFGQVPQAREDVFEDFYGMNPECKRVNQSLPENQEYKFLEFDGHFESGNIDYVIKNHPQEAYDIFLRPDTNTSGYFQWFYFKVTNRCKGTKARFNIVNLTKKNSLYQQGMPIQIMSIKKAKDQGKNWQFGGDNIKYGISKLIKNQMMNQDPDLPKTRIYFQLGWDYTFEYDNDTVYFAYSIPYTFSMVTNLVLQIQEAQDKVIGEFRKLKAEENFNDPSVTENSFKIVESSTLTSSLAGIEIPMLTITNFGHSKNEEMKKKVIILTGRVHPGESHSSWIVHGIIKFLLSKEKVASEMRKRLIFKIIPMINADGVTIGNSRCSMIGRDMNRMFSHPNQKLVPEPFFIRSLIRELVKNEPHKILAYLDFHAHSQKKSIFMYGPYFPLHSSKYMKIRAIPKLASERTEMFRFFSCKFKVEKYKESCARLAIWRDFNITNTFTVEASSFGFLNKQRETIHFDTGLLQEFGECLVHSIFEFNLIQEEDRKMKVALAKKLKEQRKCKRMTIAEILNRTSTRNQGTLDNPRSSIFRSQVNVEPLRIENPNEACDEQINIEIPNVGNGEIGQGLEQQMSDDSSHEWGGSSSSSSNAALEEHSPTQINMFQREQDRVNIINGRYSEVGFESLAFSPKVEEFILSKRGLNIPDGEEVFHMLYNPHLSEWKSKRQDYVKYEQLVKFQKRSQRRHLRTASQSMKDHTQVEGPIDGINAENFKQRQRDEYYKKEIRTFDEVFKAIKKAKKDFQTTRQSMDIEDKVSEEEEDDENESSQAEDDEMMEIPEGMLGIDDQDIGDEDRQVLNDRILGIINVFQSVSNQTNLRKLPMKQMKDLQEIGRKALSIEQRPKTELPNKSPSPIRKAPRTQVYSNLRYETSTKKPIHRELLEEVPRNHQGGNPLAAINFLHQVSNTELVFQSQHFQPKKQTMSNNFKKKRDQKVQALLIQPAHLNPPQSAVKNKCNIYNIGVNGLENQAIVHSSSQLKGGKFTNKLNFLRHNIDFINEGPMISQSQTLNNSIKKNQRMPQFFSSSNSNANFQENLSVQQMYQKETQETNLNRNISSLRIKQSFVGELELKQKAKLDQIEMAYQHDLLRDLVQEQQKNVQNEFQIALQQSAIKRRLQTAQKRSINTNQQLSNINEKRFQRNLAAIQDIQRANQKIIKVGYNNQIMSPEIAARDARIYPNDFVISSETLNHRQPLHQHQMIQIDAINQLINGQKIQKQKVPYRKHIQDNITTPYHQYIMDKTPNSSNAKKTYQSQDFRSNKETIMTQKPRQRIDSAVSVSKGLHNHPQSTQEAMRMIQKSRQVKKHSNVPGMVIVEGSNQGSALIQVAPKVAIQTDASRLDVLQHKFESKSNSFSAKHNVQESIKRPLNSQKQASANTKIGQLSSKYETAKSETKLHPPPKRPPHGNRATKKLS